MLASIKFLGLFLLSVVGGNMLNSFVTYHALAVNNSPITYTAPAAGASGGIMGIGMALLIFALFKVRVGNMRLDLKGLLLVMGINLMYGFFVPGIDNAGHIGGAITGGLLALAFASVWRCSKTLQNCFYWLAFAIISIGFSWTWLVLHQQIMPLLA